MTVTNVPSYRHLSGVVLEVPGEGMVKGDVAWGGNWFFLVEEHQEEIRSDNTGRLTDFAAKIRDSLEENRVTGAGGGVIDHIELFGPGDTDVDSRNFKGTWAGDQVIPEITGSAFVNGEATLIFDPRDPFRMGIPI